MRNNYSYNIFSNSIYLYDSFLLDGVGDALYRITKSVNNREKIVIYGSYDVEGITSVSLLMLILKYLNADVEYYIPDVIDSEEIFTSSVIEDHIRFLGAGLIITVGCGINSYREVEICKRLGIDVIITDYHALSERKPSTIIINPNQDECKYPFKHLNAVGVAYKLAYAIAEHYHVQCVEKYLDLVAIGIASSTIPIIDENLAMLEKGMYYLSISNNYGIKAITKINKINSIDFNNVKALSNFVMPKINAVGRMDDARIVVELFTTSDIERAEQIAKYMKKNNRK